MLYFDYEVVYYSLSSGRCPVEDYIIALDKAEKAEILQSINLLWKNDGRLPAPYSKHIYEKIWELRIKTPGRHHRILYFISPHKKIVLLSAFLKKSKRTPQCEIQKAQKYYIDFLSSL